MNLLENPSWCNSISSVLSSNDRIFASGASIKGTPGWWALHHWEPPVPPRKLIFKRELSKGQLQVEDQEREEKEDEIIISSGGEEQPLNITEESQSEAEMNQFEDLIVDESSDELNNTDHATETQDYAAIIEDKIDPTLPVVPSADLKQQLLERLLMMDSSLLQDAIKKAKAKKLAEIDGQAKKKTKAEAAEAKTATLNASQIASEETQAFSLPRYCLDALEPFSTALTAHFKQTPVIRASPYENDLLKKCNRVNYHGNPTVARLRRKLLLRRQRRRVDLCLFDIDQWMYLYLKSTEYPLAPISKTSSTGPNPADTQNENIKPVEFPLNFDPQSIPYIADPSKSLYVKLTGMAALYGTCPYPIISPFTGKLLPEFVCEERDRQDIPKLMLLNQIKSLKPDIIHDPGCNESDDIDYSSLIKPSTLNTVATSVPGGLMLKYTNLRKEFVGQLNDLLSDSFWPGIDVSEALECPDSTIIALVGLSVVGCAIFNPDGYLSYLYVRPDFRGHNLSSKMLSLLIPNLSPRKDLTLHVSVSNTPAMLLYQRIGFKPEEFIVNFYDKYFGIDKDNPISNFENKNAFLMRLRR